MFSPAFHVQNALSNAFQSYLGIGADAFNLKKIWKAADVLKLKDKKQTVTLGGKTYSYAQLEHICLLYTSRNNFNKSKLWWSEL